MGNVVQSCPAITLGDMVIPGTHDSGSYSIDTFKLFSAVARTQNVGVMEQLHRGARFLDLRIAGSGSSVKIFHGCVQGGKFERILDDIQCFCEDFPGEFLIVEVVAEYGRSFDASLKKKALDILKLSIGDKLYTGGLDKLLKTPVKDLILNGKKICVLLHPRIYENFVADGVQFTGAYIAKEYGFFNADEYMNNQWKYVETKIHLVLYCILFNYLFVLTFCLMQ